MTTSITTPRSGRISENDCDVDDFAKLVSQETSMVDYPLASGTTRNVLTYDASSVRELAGDAATRSDLQDELAHALLHGPGIVVFQGAFTEDHALDEATRSFTDTIARQHASGVQAE